MRLKMKEAKEKMVAAIRTLKESYRKYEQKIRDGKVSAIRMYFDLRKTKKNIDDIRKYFEDKAIVKKWSV